LAFLPQLDVKGTENAGDCMFLPMIADVTRQRVLAAAVSLVDLLPPFWLTANW
jgi:hypothetical protein